MNPIDMSGGGGYSADFGATASNQGGTNTVGGTVFGDYAAPSNGSNLLPWLIGGAVILGVVFMVKGGK